MDLNDEDIEEFKAIYESEFGEELSMDEARAMASRLLHLYIRLARPLPRDHWALETNRQSIKISDVHPGESVDRNELALGDETQV